MADAWELLYSESCCEPKTAVEMSIKKIESALQNSTLVVHRISAFMPSPVKKLQNKASRGFQLASLLWFSFSNLRPSRG